MFLYKLEDQYIYNRCLNQLNEIEPTANRLYKRIDQCEKRILPYGIIFP